MRVLVACEFSGRVREAFRAKGHDAWSCDLLPADDDSPHHYQCDVFDIVDKGWDLMIAPTPTVGSTILMTSTYQQMSVDLIHDFQTGDSIERRRLNFSWG